MAKGFSVRSQPGFVFVAMLCFFLLYLPIATLVFYAFNAGSFRGGLGRIFIALVSIGDGTIRRCRRQHCARYSSR